MLSFDEINTKVISTPVTILIQSFLEILETIISAPYKPQNY